LYLIGVSDSPPITGERLGKEKEKASASERFRSNGLKKEKEKKGILPKSGAYSLLQASWRGGKKYKKKKKKKKKEGRVAHFISFHSLLKKVVVIAEEKEGGNNLPIFFIFN